MSSYTIRIVNLDSYMCYPIQGLDVKYSEFRGSSINQVPVLRLFGSTTAGHKICVHIHGVFPYFYIPYDGVQEANSLMYQIAAHIDKAVNISLNQSSSNTQHVYKVTLVSGIPMYGYHSKKHQFFKVYLYNPMLIRKVSNLLSNEATLGKFYQPHETHLNFVLQFMIDYNLHGMSNMVLSEMKFRTPNNISDIDPKFLLPASISKMSVCELEGDTCAEHIVNRQEIASGNLAANPGIDALWADEMQRRRNKGEISQIEHFLELKNTKVGPTKSHYLYKQALLDRLAIISTDRHVEKLDLSVYPAETPIDSNVQNASIIDIHTPSSLELSLNDTTLTSSNDLDNSIMTSQQSGLNETLDVEAWDLLKILEDLEENNKDYDEEDSILSQVVKNDEDEERDVDLSMPLEAITTPKKIIPNREDSGGSDEEFLDDLNVTLIPQVDGECCDESEENLEDTVSFFETNEMKVNEKINEISKNGLYVRLVHFNLKKGRDMPLLDDDTDFINNKLLKPNYAVRVIEGSGPLNEVDYNCNKVEKVIKILLKPIVCNIDNKKIKSKKCLSKLSKVRPIKKRKRQRKEYKKISESATLRELKKLENGIKKMKRRDKLLRIKNKLHKKENRIITLLCKGIKPKFKIRTKRKIHPQYNFRKILNLKKSAKIVILNEIMSQIANHVDPDLYLTIRYPNRKCFLFLYNKNIRPSIIRIPNKLNLFRNEKLLKKFINTKRKKNKLKLNKNDQLKEIIDADNNRNCYIFSSMYLLSDNINGNSLLSEANKDSSKVLTEAIEDIQNTLQTHIEYLKKPSVSISGLFNNTNNLMLQSKYRDSTNETLLSNNKCELSFKINEQILKEKVIIDKLLDAYNKNSETIVCDTSPIRGNNKDSLDKLMKTIEDIKQKLHSCIDNLKCNSHCKSSCENCNIFNRYTSKQLKDVLESVGKAFGNDKITFQKGSDFFIKENNNDNCSYRIIGDENINKDVSKYKSTIVNNCTENLCSNSSKQLENAGFRNTQKVNHYSEIQENNNCDKKYLLKQTYVKDCGIISTNNNESISNVNCFEGSSCSLQDQYSMDCHENGKNTGFKLRYKKNVCISSDGPKRHRQSSRKRNSRENIKQITERKTCLSLDGSKDSSSSDEEHYATRLARKRHLQNEAVGSCSAQYTALPITVTSSPANFQKTGASVHKHRISINTKEKSKKEEAQINENPSQKICDTNVKRKLTFSNNSILQNTIAEEKLTCSFAPKQREAIISDKASINRITVIQQSEQLTQHFNKADEQIKKVYSNNFCEFNNDDNCNVEENSNSSHSTIYESPECDDDQKSFFTSPQVLNTIRMLTTAERYDKQVNYSAKEGTSKVFTPEGSGNYSSAGLKSSGETQNSSGSSSFDLLTPYQRVVKEIDPNLSVVDEENENYLKDCSLDILDSESNISSSASKDSVETNEKCDNAWKAQITTIVPLKKAPTKKNVLDSLDIYNLKHVKQTLPFYSKIEDVTGSVEVGYNVLKICSKTTEHLPEFESRFDSMNNFRKLKLESVASSLQWKKSNIKNVMLSFCKNKQCIITPVKKPPTVKMVINWIKDNSTKIDVHEKRVEKKKIYIPQSPVNNENDEDMDISLTISPCTPSLTPSNSQYSSSQSTLCHTPKSSISVTIESNSPILSQEPKKRKKLLRRNLLLQSNNPVLQKQLVSSRNSILNQSNQITGVTVNNTYGFNNSSEDLQKARALVEHQYLTLLVMEMHIRTRGDFKPNPEYDSIRAIFYSLFNDVPENHKKASHGKGIIAINSLPLSPGASKVPILDGVGVDCDITYVDSEENLFNEFLKVINYWDPDIFAGYEIELLSWGYLIERAYKLGMNIKPLLARTKENVPKWKDEDQNELKIVGRIVLDVWRLMRHEIALQSYTFESIVYHILHKRVPHYSFKHLSFWWDHRSSLYRHRTVKYYLFRVVMILELFDKLDLIGRTSELARLFGIQFYEVLSRGSQFRVESMMLRLAKPLNFIPVSPSVQQRANMKAPEYIALILEPESKLYTEPVIVLDFQSLYPSIVIAYNYCFTTCIGRVECLGKNIPFEFGATQLKISRKKVEKLVKKDLLNYSPCGVAYVKKEVRDGILPRMLREILDTRLMVKNAMKENKNNAVLQKVLHNRQLGLKLIANVTYGYTAANFSGRMPSVEVGDSIVSKGRETLQRAIELVDSTPEWGARVVYGDTDSLFVLVPGRSREHAFEVGKKIAAAVTDANPDPIKLKLEKVYQPCILQTKKRYVGYMYESPDQKEPEYDAKGIETVRRDGCPAVSKMLEKCLRLLFETKDVSLIKKYVLRQFNKIISGRVSIQDLTFAKEYRGISGYRPGACVPSLELAKKWTAIDKRNEPRNKERVPYIIVNGPPGLPLIRLVRSPIDLLNDPTLRPNALYYITKVIIPPINRCFNLIGADLNTWFNQMPRKQMQYLPNSVSPGKKSTISQYFSTTNCAACGEQTQTGICDKCDKKPQITTIILMEKLKNWEENSSNCNLICQSCTCFQAEVSCISLDCPVLYRRIQTDRDIQQSTYVRQLLTLRELF